MFILVLRSETFRYAFFVLCFLFVFCIIYFFYLCCLHILLVWLFSSEEVFLTRARMKVCEVDGCVRLCFVNWRKYAFLSFSFFPLTKVLCLFFFLFAFFLLFCSFFLFFVLFCFVFFLTPLLPAGHFLGQFLWWHQSESAFLCWSRRHRGGGCVCHLDSTQCY